MFAGYMSGLCTERSVLIGALMSSGAEISSALLSISRCFSQLFVTIVNDLSSLLF